MNRSSAAVSPVVGVRVVLAGQLAVRLLDLVGCRRPWGRRASCRSPSPGSPWCSSASPLLSSGLLVVARLLGLGDGDPRRADHPVTDPVAGLEDLDAGRLGDVGGVRVDQRLVDRRVERLAGRRRTRSRPSLLDGRLERLADRLEAALELAVVAGPADVVEHRAAGW